MELGGRNGKCNIFHKNLAVKWANQPGRRGFWRSWSGLRPDFLPRIKTSIKYVSTIYIPLLNLQCNWEIQIYHIFLVHHNLCCGQFWAIENLFSLLSTCIRLGLIGYQGRRRRCLGPHYLLDQHKLNHVLPKHLTVHQNLLYIPSGPHAKGSGTNGHEINCVMCSHGTGDQFDGPKKMYLHKFATSCSLLKPIVMFENCKGICG